MISPHPNDPQVHLAVDDARTVHAAGAEFARRLVGAFGAVVLCATGPALAQAPMPGTMPGHQGMQRSASSPATGGGPGATAATSGSQQEMMAAMEKMDRDMAAAPMSGDPDRDLVAMMLPHHRGAVDMARIYLREGRDPAIRRMARKIIADQEREMREMRAWQAAHPAPSR